MTQQEPSLLPRYVVFWQCHRHPLCCLKEAFGLIDKLRHCRGKQSPPALQTTSFLLTTKLDPSVVAPWSGQGKAHCSSTICTLQVLLHNFSPNTCKLKDGTHECFLIKSFRNYSHKKYGCIKDLKVIKKSAWDTRAKS